MILLSTLREFFSDRRFVQIDRRRPLVVAFSGGPDSLALLAGLAALREEGLPVADTLVAAHLDHAADPGSAERAERARSLAQAVGVSFRLERRDVTALRLAGESWETAARRVRYGFLEAVREKTGAAWIALAHHRDDQAETVLLRWLLGSGLYGLAAMRPIHGTKVRPLLGLPKAALAAFVEERGLQAIVDPGNVDPASLRNRIRHRLLPALGTSEGLVDLPERLARLGLRAAGASDQISARLARRFPGLAATEPFLDRRSLQALPPELWAWALAALARAAGADLPPSRRTVAEITRRLARPEDPAETGAGTVAGGSAGWRIEADRLRIEVRGGGDSPDPSEIPGFTYTFSTPGRIEVPEADMALTLRRGEFAPWMLVGDPQRAGLALPLGNGDAVEVRSRRPGDRLRPLGAPGTRKLKELLIDRRIDRIHRDRLPLLCVGGRIAWVPGVTIDDRFRVCDPETPVWIAEIQPLPRP